MASELILKLGNIVRAAFDDTLREDSEIAKAYQECLDAGYVVELRMVVNYRLDHTSRPAKKPLIASDAEWLEDLHKLQDPREE